MGRGVTITGRLAPVPVVRRPSASNRPARARRLLIEPAARESGVALTEFPRRSAARVGVDLLLFLEMVRWSLLLSRPTHPARSRFIPRFVLRRSHAAAEKA